MSSCPNRFQFAKMWGCLWEFISFFVINSNLTACRASVCAGQLEQSAPTWAARVGELQESCLNFQGKRKGVFWDPDLRVLLLIPSPWAALGRGGRSTVQCLSSRAPGNSEMGAIPQHSSCVSKFGRDFYYFRSWLQQQQQCYCGCGKGEVGSVSKDFMVSLTRGSLVGEEGEEKGKTKSKTTWSRPRGCFCMERSRLLYSAPWMR